MESDAVSRHEYPRFFGLVAGFELPRLLDDETLSCADGFARALPGAVWEVAEPVTA